MLSSLSTFHYGLWFAMRDGLPVAPEAGGLGLVVSWRDRPELAQALPMLADCAARYGGDVTIANYGGSRAELLRMIAPMPAPIRVVTVDGEQWFNKARAQNVGAAHTPYNLLFFCDCDILVSEGALDEFIAAVRRGPEVFGTVAGVTETERNARKAGKVVMFGYQLKLRLANGRTLQIVDNEEDADQNCPTRAGPLFPASCSKPRTCAWLPRPSLQIDGKSPDSTLALPALW